MLEIVKFTESKLQFNFERNVGILVHEKESSAFTLFSLFLSSVFLSILIYCSEQDFFFGGGGAFSRRSF